MGAAPPPLWRPAAEVLAPDGACDVTLLCEHASNHLPAHYRGLRLAADDLERHIAWDIGAADLTRRLSARLDAPAFLGTHSRLLVDLNRPLGSSDSIPVRSEDTDIPGNVGLDRAERERRAAAVFAPFHAAVSLHLDQRRAAGRRTRLATVHSFTPVFQGRRRPWHAGVLFDRAGDMAATVLASLRAEPSLVVEANVPYTISPDGDYAVPVHGDRRGIEAVLIEVRQDLLSSAAGVEAWTDRLAAALAPFLGADGPVPRKSASDRRGGHDGRRRWD